MRKLLVFVLAVVLGVLVYLVVDVRGDHLLLKEEVKSLEFRRDEFDRKKEDYSVKAFMLDSLMEEKKDSIVRYEEVSVWNEEIKGYLD